MAHSMTDSDTDARQYVVVVNHEEQYSLWLADKTLPIGWRSIGVVGDKEECLRHIERVWRDMRPRSIRRHVDGA
jgi:MbtH protein